MKDRMMSEEPKGLPRRELLKCMAWAGTGVLVTVGGGVPGSALLDEAIARPSAPGFSFVQVSDSHIGFNKPPNPDARATFAEALAKIRALETRPDFIVHTGDVSQLSRDEEFDDANEMLRELNIPTFFIPGEHDVLDEGRGAAFHARFGKGTPGQGWYSFDHRGVHVVALVNVLNLQAGGMGSLGRDQLDWLRKDLQRLAASTPIVVLAHIPLWTLYESWGWGTDDAAEALRLLARFGSVTILNGHIHQIAQKVEGNLTFHTARSTAFPQPAPGAAASPGPLKVEPGRLRETLGITAATLRRGRGSLALIDSTLA
jgi:3',5'-cyclic AMP phosphodiesterase CpdA